jgi:protease secretion system membrane fusion protein
MAQTTRDALAPDDEALRMAHRGLWILGVGLGGFLLWAGLAPLDQGVPGHGTVAVAGEKKVVQSLLDGSIERILVNEGDRVVRGQPLVQLNTVQAQAQLEIALGHWLTARSVEVRLLAERAGQAAIEWPPDLLARQDDPRVRAALELQTNLFATRAAELASQLQILEHERAALAEQLAGQEAVKKSFDAQIAYQKEELDGVRQLAEKGYVPRNRLLEVERDAAQLRAQQSASAAEIGRLRQAIQENRLRLEQAPQTFRSEAGAQLTQIATEASNLADQLEALEFQVQNGAIVAPVDGQVVGLAVHTEGGVVPAGQRLMDIVPQSSAWVIKAQFPPLLADKLHPGLPVRIRFSTLQRVRTPVLEGRVATVSADQIVDEHSREPYFSVAVEVDPAAAAELRASGLEVRPGMQAEVLVKTGERTLLAYLTQPLTERLVSAFTEE